MENVSRALIIIGGMLLAILIMSLLVFVFNKISVLPTEQIQQHSELGIVEFNRSFEVYQKPLMYGTDIISVINKAVDHNMNNGLLSANSNFFSKSFTNSITGELMTIDATINTKEDKLDLFTRVRIFYVTKDEKGQLAENEYMNDTAIEGHEKETMEDVLISEKDKESKKNYQKLLNASGVDLTGVPFRTNEYPYDFKYGKSFMKKNNDKIKLFAGEKDQDVEANKSLMKFLEAEPITIINPDPKDSSWSRIVITPASSKIKRLIFKSLDDKTEYYQNGRIKKMCFEEI